MTVTQAISTDKALELLADRQRRRVLHHLVDSNGPATIDQLIEAVSNKSSSRGPNDLRKLITVNLHHIHLPKLQEAGLIEMDTQSETIRYNPDQQVEDILQVCSSK